MMCPFTKTMLNIVCRSANIGGGSICVCICLSICLSVCASELHVQKAGHHLCVVKHWEYAQTCGAHVLV